MIAYHYRNVIEYYEPYKQLKVEVYLPLYKLCVYPNTDDIRMHSFSQLDSVGKYNKDTNYTIIDIHAYI